MLKKIRISIFILLVIISIIKVNNYYTYDKAKELNLNISIGGE
jgi:uncharacterized protein YpmB